MHTLLSAEGHKVEAAGYVNQWRYIAFGTEKCEDWMCDFFFNNRSLSGDTLLCQFDQVTKSCEIIGSRVYGLVMDTGGNHATFVSRLCHEKILLDASWLSDDICYIKNLHNPIRKIYFWF